MSVVQRGKSNFAFTDNIVFNDFEITEDDVNNKLNINTNGDTIMSFDTSKNVIVEGQLLLSGGINKIQDIDDTTSVEINNETIIFSTNSQERMRISNNGLINMNSNDIVQCNQVTGSSISFSTINGFIQTPNQTLITSVGTLSSLNMGGNIDLNTNDIIDVGNLDVGGNLDISGTLDVTGNSSMTGTLDVTGQTNFYNELRINSADGNSGGIIKTSNESGAENKLVLYNNRGNGGINFNTIKNSSEYISMAVLDDGIGVDINGRLNVYGDNSFYKLQSSTIQIGRADNYMKYSEDVSNWTIISGNVSVSSNDVISPSGATNADTITINNTGLGLRRTIGDLTASTQYTVLFWAKTISTTNSSPEINIDLRDGASGSGVPISNEWKRYKKVLTSGTGGNFIDFNFNINFTSGDTISIWGVQINLGDVDYITPYLKTSDTNRTTIEEATFINGELKTDTLTATNINGTLQTASQPNITSVGTLTGLNLSGKQTISVDSQTETSPGLLIQPTATTSQDAVIRLQGARNSSTSSEHCQIVLSNYDSDVASANLLGKINGEVTNGILNIGDIVIYSSSDGTSTTEAMRISSRNDTFILGSLINTRVEAQQTTNRYAIYQNTDATDSYTFLEMDGSSSSGRLSYGAGSHRWRTGSTNASIGTATMELDSSGNLGIGNLTPGYRLDVNGDINFSGSLRQSGNNLFGSGTILKKTILLDGTDFTLTTTVSNNNPTQIMSYSYTPVSNNSYILIEFDISEYTINGNGLDVWYSYLKVGVTSLTRRKQQFLNASGGGTRSGTLFPIKGRYNNITTNSKSIVVEILRTNSDDTLSIFNTDTNYEHWATLTITEIRK